MRLVSGNKKVQFYVPIKACAESSGGAAQVQKPFYVSPRHRHVRTTTRLKMQELTESISMDLRNGLHRLLA